MKFSLYYDGDCQFCKRYADILKLKKCLDIEILDARVDKSFKEFKKDIDLDDGVILIYEQKCFQGVEAIEMLLSICKYKGTFFSLQKFIFSNNFLGTVVYACFQLFRKLALTFKK